MIRSHRVVSIQLCTTGWRYQPKTLQQTHRRQARTVPFFLSTLKFPPPSYASQRVRNWDHALRKHLGSSDDFGRSHLTFTYTTRLCRLSITNRQLLLIHHLGKESSSMSSSQAHHRVYEYDKQCFLLLMFEPWQRSRWNAIAHWPQKGEASPTHSSPLT